MIKAAKLPAHKVNTFARAAAQFNTIRSSVGRLRTLGSEVRCFYSFGELRGGPPFPTHGRTLMGRSGLCNSVETLYKYISRQLIASVALHQPTDWRTPTISRVCRGTKQDSKGEIRFPNCVMNGTTIQALNREGGDRIGPVSFSRFPLCLSSTFGSPYPSPIWLIWKPWMHCAHGGRGPNRASGPRWGQSTRATTSYS